MLAPRQKGYARVKAGLMEAVVGARLKPGDMIPSLRDLGAQFNVSLATVQRAVRELKEEEWLVTSPRRGVMVADPLPPMAHLKRLKHARAINADTGRSRHDPLPAGPAAAGTLLCLIHDRSLLPAFEWAAHEYAAAYAPYGLRFDVLPMQGRDDAESLKNFDADLVLLPSYSVARAMRAGSISPAEQPAAALAGPLEGVAPDIIRMVSPGGVLWGVPLMIGGMLLAAAPDLCRRFDIDPAGLNDMPSLLEVLESAMVRHPRPTDDVRLFNLAFPRTLAAAAGHTYPAIAATPDMLARPEVRDFFERLRKMAAHSMIALQRFDQWERADFNRLALCHVPSSHFLREPGLRNARLLPIPRRGAILSAACMCVSARSVHPFEAWEWALRLAGPPFQARLAAAACDVPVNRHSDVRRALAGLVGEDNAATMLQVTARPDGMYGMQSGEDAMLYGWEVIGNEVHRFVAGVNDYARMLERARVKTERFLKRRTD